MAHTSPISPAPRASSTTVTLQDVVQTHAIGHTHDAVMDEQAVHTKGSADVKPGIVASPAPDPLAPQHVLAPVPAQKQLHVTGPRAARDPLPESPYAVRFGALLAPAVPLPVAEARPGAAQTAFSRIFSFDQEMMIVRIGAALHPDLRVRESFVRVVSDFERASERFNGLRAKPEQREKKAAPHRSAPRRDHTKPKITDAKQLAFDQTLRDRERSSDIRRMLDETCAVFAANTDQLREGRAIVDGMTQHVPSQTWQAIFSSTPALRLAEASLPDVMTSIEALRNALQQPSAAPLLAARNPILWDAQQLLILADEIVDHLREIDSFAQLIHHCVINHRALQQLLALLHKAPADIAREVARIELEAEADVGKPSKTARKKSPQPAAKRLKATHSQITHVQGDSTDISSHSDEAQGASTAASPTRAAVMRLPDAGDDGAGFKVVVRHASVIDAETGRSRPIVTRTPEDQSLESVWRRWAPGTWSTPASCAAYHFGKHAWTMVRPNPSDPPTIEDYTDMAWALIHDPAARARAERREYLRATLDGAAGLEAREYQAFHVHDGRNFAIFIQHVRDDDDVRIVSAGKYVPLR